MANEVVGGGQTGTSAPEPPRFGALEATIDDKNRLRIPAQYVSYIKSLGDTTVFTTCVNRETARVYPMSVWRENEKLMRQKPSTPQEAAKVAAFEWLSRDTGVESEIDGNGRVSLHPNLRSVLGLQPKSSVQMMFLNDAFDMVTEAVVQKKRQAMMGELDEGGMSMLRSYGVR